MNKCYVCVAGFDDTSQVKGLKYLNVSYDSDYELVCGILVSHDSLNNKFKLRFPKFDDIVEMTEDISSRTDNRLAIHYCPKMNSPEQAVKDTKEIFERLGFDLWPEYFQINSGSLNVIQSIIKEIPRHVIRDDCPCCSASPYGDPNDNYPEIILQLNQTILGKYNNKHSLVMDEFARIKESMQLKNVHCLYDLSGGKGKKINPGGIDWDGVLIPHSELNDKIRKYGFTPGIAGGLNAENIETTGHSFGRYVSVDCESGARDNNVLNINKVNAFFANAKNAKDRGN